jgi:hypothetical protein
MIGSSVWENFDNWADRLVAKTCTFAEFASQTANDLIRMSRIAARRRRPPSWIRFEDIGSDLLAYCWYYAFEHRCKTGKVGYDAARGRSPGAYLRFCIRKHVQKDLSRARGENQHRRSGPAAPEYLSKTGELGGPGGVPDRAGAEVSEEIVERSLRFDRLAKLCDNVREFVIISAIARGLGDDRRVIAFLLEHPEADALGFGTAESAADAVDGFVDAWAKQLGAQQRKKKRAVTAKGAMAA